MLIDALALSVAVGKARRGRFRRLANLELRWISLLVTAFVLQYAALDLSLRGLGWVKAVGPWLFMGTFLLLLVGLGVNWQHRELRLVALGIFLNFLVIAANGGHMPVSPTAIEAAGLEGLTKALEEGTYFTHTAMQAGSRLAFLGDVFVLPPPYPRPRVFSIGDALMAVGVFWLIQRVMLSSKVDRPVEKEASQGLS